MSVYVKMEHKGTQGDGSESRPPVFLMRFFR